MLQWKFLGQAPYAEAWEMQRELRERRIAGDIPDTILLLEHPPTITLGRLRGEESLRLTQTELEERGVTVVRSDRGGDATLHAPGQLVGYLIVNLRERRLRLPDFVEGIANVMIRYLNEKHDVSARYDSDFPGVWIDHNKITAFGFHLKQDVTMHGFAMNLSTDLSLFDLIVPCGLQNKGVASLAQFVEESPSCEAMASVVVDGIADWFGTTTRTFQTQEHTALQSQ